MTLEIFPAWSQGCLLGGPSQGLPGDLSYDHPSISRQYSQSCDHEGELYQYCYCVFHFQCSIQQIACDVQHIIIKLALYGWFLPNYKWRWWNSSWAISNPKRCCCWSGALNMPANLENSAVATGLEKVSFNSNPKERQCQRMLKLSHTIALISHTSKVMLKILQARLQ